jgi:hypothetical protein
MHRNTDTDFVDICDFWVDSDEFERFVVAETRVALVLLPGRCAFVCVRSCAEELEMLSFGCNEMGVMGGLWLFVHGRSTVGSRDENMKI